MAIIQGPLLKDPIARQQVRPLEPLSPGIPSNPSQFLISLGLRALPPHHRPLAHKLDILDSHTIFIPTSVYFSRAIFAVTK